MPNIIFGKKSDNYNQLQLKDIMNDWQYSHPTERSRPHINFIEMNKNSADVGV